MIIDPCAGSGVVLKCAKELNREAVGYEIDTNFYNKSLEYIKGGDKQETNRQWLNKLHFN